MASGLGNCHGYLVLADDGLCGRVETPLFPADSPEPDFLIVRIGGRLWPRFPVVPAGLVRAVEEERELIVVTGASDEIEGLPEHLPLG